MKIQPDTYLTACGLAPMPKKTELNGWRNDDITEKQKATLDKYGIAYARIKYKGQASLIINIIFKREEENKATPKQIQILLKNGYSIGRIHLLTKRGASKIISGYSKLV